MVQAASAPSEWDYEWDYTKGLLNQNGNGFTYVTVGATGYSCIIENDYLRFRGSSANYKRYDYGSVYNTGVMEAEIYVNTNGVLLLAFSDGEHIIGVNLRGSSSYQGIYFGTTTTTKLVSAKAETKYKVRLVLKPGLLGDVYVGGNLVSENIDVSTYTGDKISVTGRGSGTGNVYSRLYSLKMKFNRTE